MSATILQFIRMDDTKSPPPNRIRELRRGKGLTQEQLGEMIGVNQNHISRIESGNFELTLSRMRAIARVLDVDVGQLLAPADNRLGLSDEALALVDALRREPRLAEPVLGMVQSVQKMLPAASGDAAREAPAEIVPMQDRRRHGAA